MKIRAIRGVHIWYQDGDVGQWLGFLPFRGDLE
jgi:hypothetical protein